MLKHVVLFTFKSSSSQSEVIQVVNSFKSLEQLIPEVLEFESGLNISPENHHQGFTHCFSLTFESLKTLASYQVNKHHLEFQKILKPHMKKVFVVDYYTD